MLVRVRLTDFWTLEWDHPSSLETCFFFCCFLPLSTRPVIGRILSFHETPAQLDGGLENVTWAAIHIVVSSTFPKQVKFQIWLNCPFNYMTCFESLCFRLFLFFPFNILVPLNESHIKLYGWLRRPECSVENELTGVKLKSLKEWESAREHAGLTDHCKCSNVSIRTSRKRCSQDNPLRAVRGLN